MFHPNSLPGMPGHISLVSPVFSAMSARKWIVQLSSKYSLQQMTDIIMSEHLLFITFISKWVAFALQLQRSSQGPAQCPKFRVDTAFFIIISKHPATAAGSCSAQEWSSRSLVQDSYQASLRLFKQSIRATSLLLEKCQLHPNLQRQQSSASSGALNSQGPGADTDANKAPFNKWEMGEVGGSP